MSINSDIRSATIHPFPLRPRLAARRFQDELRHLADQPYPVVIDVSGAWYHAEAVREAETASKS